MTSILKKLAAIAMAISATGAVAHADSTWLGNIQIRLAHRGQVSTTEFHGQTTVDNIAGYNDFTISFSYYEAGVTDVPGVSVWQSVNAQAQLVQDDTLKVLKSGSIPVAGSDGNNAVYSFDLNQFSPDTVWNLNPEMQNGGTMNTHLNIVINGNTKASLPFAFSYRP